MIISNTNEWKPYTTEALEFGSVRKVISMIREIDP
jgi:hypothetical protein